MIEQLFGSKTRVKLLQLFFSNPNRSFYVREITRKIDEQINSVRRELANLLSIGIISSDTNNNRLYYEVNQKYEYYQALAMIFGGKKITTANSKRLNESTSASVENDDVSAIKQIGNVELAVLTGQFTRDESVGVDMVIIGDINQAKLNKYIADFEKKEGKDIRFVVMDTQEFEYRQTIKDRFINTLLHSKMQVLVDKNGVLAK